MIFNPLTCVELRRGMDGKSKRAQERGGRFAAYESDETPRVVARALYESQAGRTIADVSKEMGIPEGTLRRWKSESAKTGSPWRVQRRALPELSGRAATIADQHRVTLAEMGIAPTDAQKQEAERLVADMVAAEARAAVATRHRQEWQLVRKALYEAIQSGDAARARLARDIAETMETTQRNERRAWGLDAEALGPGRDDLVVMVERHEAPGSEAGE